MDLGQGISGPAAKVHYNTTTHRQRRAQVEGSGLCSRDELGVDGFGALVADVAV